MERHWVTQSSAQVRPFVCKECDAGFTTEVKIYNKSDSAYLRSFPDWILKNLSLIEFGFQKIHKNIYFHVFSPSINDF